MQFFHFLAPADIAGFLQLYLTSYIAPVNHGLKALVWLYYHLQGHGPKSADLQQSPWVG